MSDIKYWANRFDIQQKDNPDNPIKALNYSNYKLMNQVHEECISCIDLSELEAQSKILDTGCGTGDLLRKLISYCGEDSSHQYYATDISEQMLINTKEMIDQTFFNHSQQIEYTKMSVDGMGFKSKYFNVVLACESLQYTDPYSAILDLIRMTGKNGQIVICIPNNNCIHIQNAIKKHNGKYNGLDYEKAVDMIGPKVNSLKVKPLLFSKYQNEKPYTIKDLGYQLDKTTIQHANRFIIYLNI